MNSDTNLQAAEALRLANHAIIDAEQHLEVKDIDRACVRLSHAKNIIGSTIVKASAGAQDVNTRDESRQLTDLAREAEMVLMEARSIREDLEEIVTTGIERRVAKTPGM